MIVGSITINELLSLMKIIRERVHELRSLRSSVSTKERFFSSTEKVVEPQYDVKTVDKKVSELEKFLYQADSKIKQANATTSIDVTVDVDKLLEPLS